MIGIIKYLTIEQLSQYQDHLIISPSAFKEAQAKANMRGREQGRADERAKVIKRLLDDLNPCVFCHDSTDCDREYFFEHCANEEYISWNELRLRAEQLEERGNE